MGKTKRLRFKTKAKRRNSAAKPVSSTRSRIVMSTQQRGTAVLGYVHLIRLALSSLPITGVKVLNLFDIGFNLIKKVLSNTNYYTGAYCMFGITPAALFFNSPLLAKDSGGGYTFPGYPVSLKWISVKLKNTTQNQERSGRWAAVLIPYRESHDSKHYKDQLKDLTYAEVVAMPYARSGSCRSDLYVRFRMRDRTMYCAQPRELTEEIAVVYVVWDSLNRDALSTTLTNSSFNCEMELEGGCIPHVIFGPQHRNTFDASSFKIRSITSGNDTRVHYEDGSVRLETPLEEEFEHVQIKD